MSKTMRTSLIVIAAVVAAASLLLVGVTIGRAARGGPGFWPGIQLTGGTTPCSGYDAGNTGYRMGPAMMGTYGQAGNAGLCPAGGMMGGGFGPMGSGMMNGQYGMMGPGMMGGFQGAGLVAGEPLTLDEAREAVQGYIDGLEDDDLALGEIMIFDNHAYAQIVERSTGIGAMEVLVDPVTQAVYPEHGPNMMWNLKYGHMGGSRGFGMMGMMGGWQGNRPLTEINAEMPVTAAESVEIAQEYLDSYLPGAQADEHADPFYGYYTLHILRDGETVGMLSVNGFSGQVFVHTWHGDFITMEAGDHD